jgi:capsular polysaccharide transport system permease protein
MTATYIHTRKKAGATRIVLCLLSLLYFLCLLLSIAYMWTLMADKYVSSATFKISRQDSGGGDAGLAQLVLPGIADSSSADSQITIGFVKSVDLLVDMEREFSLVKHFSTPKLDYFFTLDPEAPLEERLTYYRNRVNAHFDRETGLTQISVETFEPELSKRIATWLLKRTEDFINKLNQDVAKQRSAFVNSELDRAAKHVEEVNTELLTLQNKHNIISPGDVITGKLKAVHELHMEQLKMTAELDALSRDSPDSPRVNTLRSRLRSVSELVAAETANLSGPEQDRLNQILLQFKQLEMRLEFAIKLRTGAETLIEKNRVDTIARSRFFSIIQQPFLPEDVAVPQRPYATATLLCLGFLVFLILRALTSSVLERAP